MYYYKQSNEPTFSLKNMINNTVMNGKPFTNDQDNKNAPG